MAGRGHQLPVHYLGNDEHGHHGEHDDHNHYDEGDFDDLGMGDAVRLASVNGSPMTILT